MHYFNHFNCITNESTFPMLCNHRHYSPPVLLHCTKLNMPIKHNSPSPSPSCPFSFLSLQICLLPVPHKVLANTLCSFVSGLFDVVHCPRGSSILQHVSTFHSFLWTNNILYRPHLVNPFI